MKDDQKKPEVPKLSPEVKKLNGKSGYRLRQCIDTLCEILDEEQPKKAPEIDRPTE